jgi:hypothetical protein
MDTSDVIALTAALVALVALFFNYKTTAANEIMATANKDMARTNQELVQLTKNTQEAAEKAENIKNLLGEKETVGYAALKVRRMGLPPDDLERRVVLDAILQACVFEGSDRARALLYKVLEDNLATRRREIEDALQLIEDTFVSMQRYGFTKEQLDLDRGERRLETVQRVIKGPQGSASSSAPSPRP